MKLMIDTAAGVALGGFAALMLGLGLFTSDREAATVGIIVGSVLGLGLIIWAVWLG